MAKESRGWFRRRKGSLVFCWSIVRPEDGKRVERSRFLGPESMSDKEGWVKVGKLELGGRAIKSCNLKPTFHQIASFYLGNKEFRKESTKSLHKQIVNDILVPRWGARVAVEIRPREIKGWLKTLGVQEPTRYKYKTVMGTVYTFAQSEDMLPLGQENNPVHYVKGIAASSDYEAIILTPEQTLRVLEFLEQPERTLTLLVAATGLRISEALGLRWCDLLYEKNEIRIRQTYVYGIMQHGAKTKASKSSVPMHPLLAGSLKAWQDETTYSRPDDYVFASYKLGGKKPRLGSMVVEDHLRPAAVKAGVIGKTDDGRTLDSNGSEIGRFGFHSFRHSLTSFLIRNGENPKLVQTLLRWSKMDMTMYYAHSMQDEKLEAQGKVLELIRPPSVR
jgi:integrase